MCMYDSGDLLKVYKKTSNGEVVNVSLMSVQTAIKLIVGTNSYSVLILIIALLSLSVCVCMK